MAPIDGFVIPGPTSARAVLEQLGEIFGFIATDTGTALAFRPALARPHALSRHDLAETGEGAALFLRNAGAGIGASR